MARCSNSRTWLLVLSLACFCSLICAQITIGPLAPVSLASEAPYSSARPCAAGCLIYNGDFPCGVGSFYQDLAIGLACGCGVTNLCYCSEPSRPMASSYISSCIENNCGTTVNYQADISSMLGLYDGYCATATVEAASTKATTTTPPRSATATRSAATGSSGVVQSETNAAASASATSTSSSEEPTNDGLKRSDVVALAASLGVGIPSILIALITLCVQIRKRRRAAAELQPPVIHHTASNNPLTSASTPQPTPPAMTAAEQAELAHMYGTGPSQQSLGGYYHPNSSRPDMNVPSRQVGSNMRYDRRW